MTTKLPPGWEWAPVEDICDVTLGQSPPGSSYNQTGRGFPFLQGKAEFGDTYPTIRKWTTEPKKFAPAGSVLISVRAPVGPTNVAPLECAVGRGLASLVPRDDISTSYLLWAMRHSEAELVRQSGGSTFEAITGTQLRSHVLPIAPLSQQKQIVAAIEEHFSRLDAVGSALDEAERRCEALVKSVLLKAIPSELPSGWCLSSVVEAGETGLGRQRSPKYHRGSNRKPYLRVANVFEDRIDTSDVMEMHFDEEDFRKYQLRVGDVLLNEGQSPEWLGRPAIYRGDPPEVAFTNSLIRFIPGSGVTSEWALLVFRRHMHAGRFMKESRITTNIAHLALGRFRTVEFPIPPREVQDDLVASTREVLDAVDRQASQIKRARAKSQMMRRAILSAAFAGNLTHQDPNDEPASALLERIATSRHTVESNI